MTSIKEALLNLKKELKNVHFMFCDVFTAVTVRDPITNTDIGEYKLLYEKRPCRLDWTINYREGMERSAPVSEIKKIAILFSDIMISAGSIIQIYMIENGKRIDIGDFEARAPSMYFVSHTETALERYERYTKNVTTTNQYL